MIFKISLIVLNQKDEINRFSTIRNDSNVEAKDWLK